MKKSNRFLSLVLALIFLFSLTIPSFCASDKNKYPIILVPGMGGWGSYDSNYKTAPYWGSADGVKKGEAKLDAVSLLNKNGYKAYAASLGPLSSAWDRACELYAQLTGTKTDYGKAHSEAHGHKRFGKDFKNKPLMKKAWNKKTPISLVGYSFGGETARLFTSLLAFGNSAEKKATGNKTSPLFKGGFSKGIRSVVCVASPHNGTQVASSSFDAKNPLKTANAMLSLSNLVSKSGASYSVSSLWLGHFGIKGNNVVQNMSGFEKFITSKDSCLYDLTISGAKKLSSKIKLCKNTYYLSYSFYVTKTVKNGKQVPKKCPDSLLASSKAICATQGKTISSVKMTKSWAINDGLVPLASAKFPSCDKKTAESFEEAKKKGKILKGRWYYLKPTYGTNHLSVMTGEELPGSFKSFFLSVAKNTQR